MTNIMKRYMTIHQAARMLKVHPDTLRRWDRAGKLATRRHKDNKYRLYTAGDLKKLIQQKYRKVAL